MNNRSQYIQAYIKENTVRITLNLSKTKDQDVIQAIEKECKGNKQAGVKSLIRKGIKYEEQEKTFKDSPIPC